MAALKDKFSRHVCDTHMMWSMSDKVAVRALLMLMLAKSEKPNRL